MDPSNRERFEAVADFVSLFSGPLTGVVLQAGVTSSPRPLAETTSETVRNPIAEVVEDAVDWCRIALPALTGAKDAALVGLWLGPVSGSIPAAASFAAWEQVLEFARIEAVPGGVDVQVVKAGRPGGGAPERNHGVKAQLSATDEVLAHLGIVSGKREVDRPLTPAGGVAK